MGVLSDKNRGDKMTDYLKPRIKNSYSTPLESLSIVASLLKDLGVNNILTLNKSRVVILFKTIDVIDANNNLVVFKSDISGDMLEDVNLLVRRCKSIIVTSLHNRKIELTRNELLAVRGVTIGSHSDLSAEYHKSKIYDFLYSNNSLYSLCARNPMNDNGIDLFKLLEIGPSQCIIDSEISLIDTQLKINGCDIEQQLKMFKVISSTNEDRPIKVVFTKTACIVTIYESIKSFRFDESIHLKNLKEDVDDDSMEGDGWIN